VRALSATPRGFEAFVKYFLGTLLIRVGKLPANSRSQRSAPFPEQVGGGAKPPPPATSTGPG